MLNRIDVLASASCGLEWLKAQHPRTIKDLSRSIQAFVFWHEPAYHLIEQLLSLKKNGCYETGTPLIDTARAGSALCKCCGVQPEIIRWIQAEQEKNNWNNSEIDAAYALIALADCGVKNEKGCEWLFHFYGKKHEHAGTTSLIITALLKQDESKYRDFIHERALWLLSKSESGGWIHLATSNLVIQALIHSGIQEHYILKSIKWLIEKQQENGCWKDITSTSLSLISLRMYLDNLNSGRGN